MNEDNEKELNEIKEEIENASDAVENNVDLVSASYGDGLPVFDDPVLPLTALTEDGQLRSDAADLFDTEEPTAAQESAETATEAPQSQGPTAPTKQSLDMLKMQYKAEKKAYRDAAREARRQEYASGTRKRFSAGLTILVSVIATLVCFGLLIAALCCFPTRESSLFSTIIKKYSGEYSARNGANSKIKVGDSEIDGSSNVTINVDGEFFVSAAYAKAVPSVVAIECVEIGADGKETSLAMGSGIVVSEDGEIMTNCHVLSSIIDTATGKIGSQYKIYVYIDNPHDEPYETTQLLGYDADFDIALIKLNCTGLKPIVFADSDLLEPGQSVVAIGSPGGLEFMNSVCDGIISGTKRSTTSESGAILYDMIQMTAPINPGNSGGAVVNSEGELVGVSVLKIVADYYENMTFAISSNTARRIIESFRLYGRYVQPVLGITVNTLYGWKEAKENGWPLGSYVEDVSEGGSCGKAGLKPGDVVCGLNGVEIVDFYSLKTNLLKYAPGDEIVLKVYRTSENKYYEFKVILSAS